MNGLTLITPTGGRAKALQLCSLYVERFKDFFDGPIQWIVVDDDREYTRLPLLHQRVDCGHIVPPHNRNLHENTLAKNLICAFDHVFHDRILFIEDDDWYSPMYAKQMYDVLEYADIVGEIPALYYHIGQRRHRNMGNRRHASLCQTGIRSSLIPLLRDLCGISPDFIDFRLWGLSKLGGDVIRKQFLQSSNCIGLKGLPGREGIGIGHRPELFGPEWQKDSDYHVLENWIGSDVSFYRNLTSLEPLDASLTL